ncbi:hypothetical protein J6590_106897, partial [Homalodisca vitripennis]
HSQTWGILSPLRLGSPAVTPTTINCEDLPRCPERREPVVFTPGRTLDDVRRWRSDHDIVGSELA